MAGATSLVQLILKKWGDDAVGAAKELEEMVGYPESVANRIATGELPMDEASRVARREAQSTPTNLFHGSTHDIPEFVGGGPQSNDWGPGTYLTDSTHDASRNYAGTHGPDFRSRVDMAERQEDYDWGLEHLGSPSQANDYARDKAIARLKGDNDGVIYPVRVRESDSILDIRQPVPMPDYYDQAIMDYGYENLPINSEMHDELLERAYELEDLDLTMWAKYPNPNHSMYKVVNKYDGDPSTVYSLEEGDSWEQVKHKLTDQFLVDDEGDYVERGRAAAEIMQDWGAKGVVDPTTPDRFESMESGAHTIIFPGNEDVIRSVNAAYDPQYTGKNIMGGAAGTAGLTGLLAAGQSEESDASVASLAARGLKLVGNDYDFAGGGTVWNILNEKGTKLGGADMGVMDGGNYSAYEMHLNPEHRGTGLMNEAYDAIEEVSGREIEPSDTLTEDGLKFWMRRDPQKLRGMADKGLLFPWEGDVLETIFAEALKAKR